MDARRGNSKVGLVDRELFFLVAKFLESSPCQEAAQVLKRELYDHKLLPTQRNWLGEERQVTYSELQGGSYEHVQSDHLQQLCSQLLSLLQSGRGNQPHSQSLLGTAVLQALQCRPSPTSDLELKTTTHVSKYHHELSTIYREQPVANTCRLVSARQMTTNFSRKSLQGPQLYKSIKKHRAFLGHLAPVFCVLFDHTGRRIITGADDDLLKVWSSETGQLLATLRGHAAEVTDVSLSCDNTMIASGSLDKSVRVWCAQSSASLAVLTGHQSHVTSVQFSPSPIEEYRYLASTGKDGYLYFWQWLSDSETFSSTPVKFMEKNRMGDQTLCSAFSPGGKYFVTGGTDHIIRVYICIPGPPTLQAELDDQHTEKIMTVQFGNTGEGLFATGSDDGIICIWRFRERGWVATKLKIPKDEVYKAGVESGKIEKQQVTMLGWEKTDTYLVSATTPDCHIRVWRSSSGEHVRTLKAHIGEVFVLETHPSDPRILLSAGHDGLVIFWDMLAGVKLKSFQLEWDNGPVCVFDCKFSPDGLTCAAVDSYGFLTIMGFGSNQLYKKQPMEQFFHTDYRPLMRDRNHYVVDEQTLLPPHLLPPPYLVNIDGHAHPACYQEALLRRVRPAEQVRQERTAEEMEDYDEYMKKHLKAVKQQSFGFGRARSNFSSSTSNSLASSSSSSFVLGHRNADSALLSSGDTLQEKAPNESGGHSSVAVVATTSTNRVEGGDISTDFTAKRGSADGDEAMDVTDGRTQAETGGENVVEEAMATDLPGPPHHNDEEEGTSGAVHVAVANQSALVEGSDKSMLTSENAFEEASCHAATIDPTVVDGPAVGSDLGGKSSEESSCNRVTESEIKTENTLKAESQSACASNSDQEVKSESNPDTTLCTSEHHYAGDTDSTAQAGPSTSPLAAEATGTSRRSSNSIGMGMDSSGISHSDTQWNGIRTRRQIQIASNSNGTNRPAENLQQRQQEQPPHQLPAPEGQPLALLAAQRRNNGRDEEGQVNIMDVDEDSQDCQNMLSSLIYSMGMTEHETKQAISLWHNRSIIPQLDPADLNAELAKRRQLYREEQENFEEQSRKAELLELPSPTPGNNALSKGRSLRSGRTLPDSPPPQRVDSIDSEPVMLSESSESEAEEWNSDDSGDSSDVSDWTAEAGIKFINENQRKRRRRKLSSREVEASSEDEYGEEEEEEVEGAASKRAEQRKERTAQEMMREPPPVIKKESKPGKKKRVAKSLEAYLPPAWILQTKPTLSPYLPQVGDVVVYCYQGHRLYLNSVREERVYSTKNVKMPWQKYKLLPQEFCQITNVRYLVGPPTLCQITLALLSHTHTPDEPSTSQQNQRITFQIKYHDMDGVLDFLILDSLYKASVVHQWSAGMKFCSLIDGTYWYGTILERKPFDVDIPDSCWQCYLVEWGDNKDTDRLSPWDMEPLPPSDSNDSDKAAEAEEATAMEDDSEGDRVSQGGGDDTAAVDDSQVSRLLLAAAPSGSEEEKEGWGREGERERILKGLSAISGLAEAYQFREPVPLDVVQDYCRVIAFPTDLSTITERLQNGFYRRKLALLWEVRLLCRNAQTYNEEDSLIVEHARILTETLWKFINSPDIDDPLQCYISKPSGEMVETEVEIQAPDVSFVSPEEVLTAPEPATSEASYSQQARSESPAQPPWISFAEKLLDTLEKNANSSPFQEPVDTDIYSDYLLYISCPMDLGTVRQKMAAGEYRMPGEFISDIELIFDNARLYNARGSEIYKMTLDLQRVFESLVIPFLNNSCPGTETGHIYGTRRALGKLATPSKRHCREEGGRRTSSISSSESFASSAIATARPQRRHRYPKRILVKSTTNRAQTRSTSREWSDAEEQQSLVDEGDSGRRSISVDASISSEELLPSTSAPRRETRSMANKRRTRAQDKGGNSGKAGGGEPLPYSRENGFGMTLRTRGTKRQLEEESGSEESGSENDQDDDESESEAESLDVEQEEEEEEEEEEESITSSLRTRNSRLRALGASKVQRKRLRRSSDSDEDLTYKPSNILIRSSRSGRLVKANTKYT